MRFSHDTQPVPMQAPVIEQPVYRHAPVALISAYPQVPPMPNYEPNPIGLAHPEAPTPLTDEALIGAAVDQAYLESGWDFAQTPAALGMPQEAQLQPVMASSSENGDVSWISPSFGPASEPGTTSYSPADNGSGAGSSSGGRGRGRGWRGGRGGSGGGNGNGNGNGGGNGPTGSQPENSGQDDGFIRKTAEAAAMATTVGTATEESIQREANVDAATASIILKVLEAQNIVDANGNAILPPQEAQNAAAQIQVNLRRATGQPDNTPAPAAVPPQPTTPPAAPAASAITPASSPTPTTGKIKGLARRVRRALVETEEDRQAQLPTNVDEVIDTYTAHLPNKAFESTDVEVLDEVVSARGEIQELRNHILKNNNWHMSDEGKVLDDNGAELDPSHPEVAAVLAYAGAVDQLHPKITDAVYSGMHGYSPTRGSFDQFLKIGKLLGEGKGAELAREIIYQLKSDRSINEKVTELFTSQGYGNDGSWITNTEGTPLFPAKNFDDELQGLYLLEGLKAKGMTLECEYTSHHDYAVKVTSTNGNPLLTKPHVARNELMKELNELVDASPDMTGSFTIPRVLRRTSGSTEPVVIPEANPVDPEEERRKMAPTELHQVLQDNQSLNVYDSEEFARAASHMGIKPSIIEGLGIHPQFDDETVIVDARGNFVVVDKSRIGTDEDYRDHIVAQLSYLGSANRTAKPDAKLEAGIRPPLIADRTRLGGNDMTDYLEEVLEGESLTNRMRYGLYGLRSAMQEASNNRAASRAARRAAAVPPTPEQLRYRRQLRRRGGVAVAALTLIGTAIAGGMAASGGSDEKAAPAPGVSASENPHASPSESEAAPSPSATETGKASTAPSPSQTSKEASPSPTNSTPDEEASNPPAFTPGQGDQGRTGGKPKPEANVDRVVDAGNETLTFAKDGSVTIKLEKGGTFSEGIRAAQRDLAEHKVKVDTSNPATYSAVASMGLKPGQDRQMAVGSTYTFTIDSDGKLQMKQ